MFNLTLRFKSYDKFSNPVFIASEKKECKAYKSLCSIEKKLKKIERLKDLFLPLYVSDEYDYATLRLWRERSLRDLEEGATYKLVFCFKEKKISERLVLAACCEKLKLMKKAPVYDEGVMLEFK